jgi:PAS domain S-box-containing protein
MRPIYSRVPLFIYLVAAGAFCVAAAARYHSLSTAGLIAGAVAVPVALVWLRLDMSAANGQRRQAAVQREREARLKAIADGPPIGLFLADLAGNFLQTNRELSDMLGFSASAFREKTLQDLTVRGDHELDATEMRELLAGERASYTVEKRLIREDEQLRWVRLTLSLVRGDDGEPRYIAASAEDVTERKQTGGALQEVEQLFRRTFDQAAVGIGHTDREGRFLFANRRLGAMLGYRREDLFGQEFRAFVHPDDVDASDLALRQLMNGVIQEYSTEQRYLRKGGTAIWGQLTMSVVQEPTGEPK